MNAKVFSNEKRNSEDMSKHDINVDSLIMGFKSSNL